MGVERFITEETFGRGTFKGDDPAVMDLTPRESVYVSAWRHACPQPDAVVKYYGDKWLSEWKEHNAGSPEPSASEVEAQGIALTRRRYDECDFVYGYIIDRIKAHGDDKAELLTALTSPTERLDDEPAGFHEPGRVPESHASQMSPLSTLVGYALPRVIIEQYGWDGKPRTWERYDKGLDIIEEAIEVSRTPEQLLAVLAEKVTCAQGRVDKVVSHVLSGGIEEEENNHNEFGRVRDALKQYAPSVWNHAKDK